MPQPRVAFHLNSDNYLQLEGLQNRVTGLYPEDATVTVTIQKGATTVVGPLPASHVAGTSGEATAYRAFVDDTVPFTVGLYDATVTAEKDGIKETFHVPITVERG